MGCISEWGATVNGTACVFLACIIMFLIGTMHVKYLYLKDSPRISFSLENAYHLKCFHLIFIFVKTKHVCLPCTPSSLLLGS